MWAQAFDTLQEAEKELGFAAGRGDNLLRIAQVQALLSISQELSKIRQEGINPVQEP